RIARARRASDHPARGSVSEGIRLWFTASPGLPTCRWFLGREATATKNANGVFTAPFKSQSRAHWVAGERRRAEILLLLLLLLLGGAPGDEFDAALVSDKPFLVEVVGRLLHGRE